MSRPTGGWRAGVRPALAVGLLGAVVSLLAHQPGPHESAGEAVLAVLGPAAFLLGLVLLLYAGRVVRSTDTSRRLPVRPSLLVVLAVGLAVALITQCPRR